MIYDWDGRRTRRIKLMRLATAIAIGLSVPLMIAAWPHV
jgi:hypothetical protein